MSNPTFELITKVSKSKREITFPFNKAIMEALLAAGEAVTLSPDGKQIHLVVDDDRVLNKCADGLYRAIILKGGAATLTDNPHAGTSFKVLKRDAGNASFASAHAQLAPHRTGPTALKPERLAKMALSNKPSDRGTAVLAAIHNAGPMKHSTLRSERNLKLRAVLCKCAGQSYPTPDAAKLALMQECVKAGLADLVADL